MRDTRLQTRRIHTIGRARSRVNKRRRARRAGEQRDDWRADAHSSTRTAGGRASGRRNERCHLSFRSAELRGTADPGRPEPGSGRARRRAGSRAYEHAARGSCTADHLSLGRASGGTRDESLVPLPRAGSCCCCCAGCGCGYLRPYSACGHTQNENCKWHVSTCSTGSSNGEMCSHVCAACVHHAGAAGANHRNRGAQG